MALDIGLYKVVFVSWYEEKMKTQEIKSIGCGSICFEVFDLLVPRWNDNAPEDLGQKGKHTQVIRFMVFDLHVLNRLQRLVFIKNRLRRRLFIAYLKMKWNSWIRVLIISFILRDNLFVLSLVIDKDLINLVIPDVRRYVVVLTVINYHLKELRCCAQCLIKDEDFIKRSRSTHGDEKTQEIESIGCGSIFFEVFDLLDPCWNDNAPGDGGLVLNVDVLEAELEARHLLIKMWESHQYGSTHPIQHYSTTYPSTPLAITYLLAPYPYAYHQLFIKRLVHNHKYVPQIEYTISTVNQHIHLAEFNQIDSSLAVLVFKQGDDPVDAINKMMSFLFTVVTSRFPSTIRTRANTSRTGGNYSCQQRIVKCFNFQGEGHMARQCLKPKRKRDATWFKEKVLLVEAQGNGKVLTEKELESLADHGITEGLVT
nr:hypothetical protein [Tanacetum cinerariifolium]